MKFFKHLFILLACLFQGLEVFSQSNYIPTIMLSDKKMEYSLGKSLQILKDSTQKLTIEQVSSPNFDRLFINNKQDKPNYGYTSNVYWSRVCVQNPEDKPQEMWLEVDYPLLDHVALYEIYGKGIIGKERKSGDKMVFGAREIDYQTFIFPITFEPNEVKTLYLSVSSKGTVSFPITLWKPQKFISESNTKQIGFGIYYGVMLVMLLYNLFLFFSLKEISYVYYVINIFSNILLQISINGLSYQHLWANSPNWNEITVPLFIAMLTFTSLLFTSSFLNMAKLMPRMNKVFQFSMAVSVLIALGTTFMPHTAILRTSTLFALPMVLLIVIAAIIAVRKGDRPARFYLLAWSLFLVGSFMTALRSNGLLPNNFITIYSIQIGSALEVILLSLGLADKINFLKREISQKTLEKTQLEKAQIEQQKEFLDEQNKRLELLVAERTLALEEQNRHTIDSIKYAEKIQKAILPSKHIISKYFPENFIYFKPKDIVSGDFYWFAEKDNKVIIATVDCTGHGVPGAFMSMIGNALLNQIVHERDTTRPSEILNQLHTEIRRLLKQEKDTGMKDGMDISLCVWHQVHNVLEYAGSHRPLYLIRDGVFQQIDGDKFPIGGFQRGIERRFTNHIIKLRTDEEVSIYLFSDGYADQFGGEANKKFMVKKFRNLLIDLSQQKNLKSQHLKINKVMEEWKGDKLQIDDMLIIGFKIKHNDRLNSSPSEQSELTGERKLTSSLIGRGEQTITFE
jgi:two-component system, sensor histidine kinase LadS